MGVQVRAIPGWLAVGALLAVCAGVDVTPRPTAASASRAPAFPSKASPPRGPGPVQAGGCAAGAQGRIPPPWQPPDPATGAKLERLLAAYLETDSVQGFRHRIELRLALRQLPEEGRSFFADVEGLRRLLYRARPFLPAFEERHLAQGGKGAEIVEDVAAGVVNVTWEERRLSLALPPAYAAARSERTLSTIAPFPMIVSLHEAADGAGDEGDRAYPGATALRRRWDPRGPYPAIRDAWVLFGPAAPETGFLRDGRVESSLVPLNAIWKRYPIDVDRIVLEGGSDALLFAAAYPNFYAGVIVRDASARLRPSLVRNLAGMRIYVVGGAPALLDDLEAGGHPSSRVVVGEPVGLLDWLGTVRRCVPSSFAWSCEDETAHRLAHWVNLDGLDPAEPERTLRAEVVDTDADPNTVRLFTHGIRTLTLFLNDRLVDLDRPVRVVVNGRPISEARVAGGKDPGGTRVDLPARFPRTLDATLDRGGLSIRKSLYFGWLFPVVLEGIEVEK